MPLSLPSIISDHMVVQSAIPVRIWGWAEPAKRITIKGQSFEAGAVTAADGAWQTEIGPFTHGENFCMTVSDDESDIVVDDILAGEVWLCSGQSNMQHFVMSLRDAKPHIDAVGNPPIRMFTVQVDTNSEPLEQCEGKWSLCNKENVEAFSAVAYFMAKHLHESCGFPVGIIANAVGASSAGMWVSEETIRSIPECAGLKELLKELPEEAPYKDHENAGEQLGWASLDYDDSEWTPVELPNKLSAIGHDECGSFWFRKEIDIPDNVSLKNARLELCPVNDFDHTYVNGILVGYTGGDTLQWWIMPRRYSVAGGILNHGRNVVSIRVFNQWSDGGVMRVPDTHMRLIFDEDEQAAIALSGTWRCMPERALPRIEVHSQRPASLYNAMLYPVRKYSLRGFAWYQGESDASTYKRHTVLFQALIKLWRRIWDMGDLPFFFVQLPNYAGEGEGDKGGLTWAYMRESQAAALALPNTGMAVIIDCGESHNIHPDNKWDPGKRLALQIERKVYGLDSEESGPEFAGCEIADGKAIVRFTHADGMHERGELDGFELAGEDKKFYPAAATLDGSAVTLISANVANPVAVRYAWADDPPSTLYNSAGLPAIPFRTDNWPLK